MLLKFYTLCNSLLRLSQPDKLPAVGHVRCFLASPKIVRYWNKKWISITAATKITWFFLQTWTNHRLKKIDRTIGDEWPDKSELAPSKKKKNSHDCSRSGRGKAWNFDSSCTNPRIWAEKIPGCVECDKCIRPFMFPSYTNIFLQWFVFFLSFAHMQ